MFGRRSSAIAGYGSASRRFRIVAAASSAAIVISSISLFTTAAHADGPSTAPTDSSDASSESSALNIAQNFGHDVTVDSESSEVVHVVAQPDGTMQAESTVLPSWVAKGSTWTPENTTLGAPTSGWVSPAEAAVPVKFSDGGTTTVAQIQDATGTWMSETWPYGTLPTPTVTESSATYPDVLSGVDLKVTVTPAGMSQVLVIKNAQAAANPNLADVEFALRNATLTAQSKTRALSATSTAGSSSDVTSAAPIWWDSSGQGASSAGAGSDEPQNLDYTASGNTISLDVADATSTPDLTYPVYVDPDWSAPRQHSWYDDVAYPNQSYLDAASDSVGFGIQDGIHYVSRAFYQFQADYLDGKHIITSHFDLGQTYANSCDTTKIDLDEYSAGTDIGEPWSKEPAGWDKVIDSESSIHGGCNVAAGTQEWNSLTFAKDIASGNKDIVQVGLRTENEANDLTRKHYNNDPSFTTTYESTPNTPSALAIASPSRTCGSANSPSYVNDVSQTVGSTTYPGLIFQAYISDPDGGNVQATFQITKTDLTTSLWTNTTSSASTSGTTQKSTTNPSSVLANGQTYAWRVDAVGPNSIKGFWSGWCYFTVDNSIPSAPAIAKDQAGSPDLNPDGTPVSEVHEDDSGNGLTGTGEPMTVDIISPASDHAALYEVWWESILPSNTAPVPQVDRGAAIPSCPSYHGSYTFTCATQGSSGNVTSTITVAPATAPDDVLHVAAVDAAGNISAYADGTTPGLQVDTLGAGNTDHNQVDYTNGHGWNISQLDPSTTTGESALADANASTVLPFTIGTSLSGPVSPSNNETQNFGTINNALPFNGYDSLDRFQDPSTQDHVTVDDDNAPTSYSASAAVLGGVIPPDSYTSTPPANLALETLYECQLSNGDEMTTTDSTCEGTGNATASLGYVWKSATDTDSVGDTVVPLYRCRQPWSQSSAEHFDSTDPTCGGSPRTVEKLLAYIAPFGTDQTSGPAVDTTKSFTVSAWVYPTQPANSQTWHTILSQSGSADSAFFLQQSAAGTATSGPARMCMRTQTSSPTTTCATAASPLPLSKWSEVTGIWDAVNHRVSIIVGQTLANGTSTGFTNPSGNMTASGPVVVGSGKYRGVDANRWNGYITDPQIFPGVIDQSQLTHLGEFTSLN